MYNKNNLLDEFKNAFNKPNNSHVRLIIINVVVFLTIGILEVFSDLSGFRGFYEFVDRQFTIPPTTGEFLTRPWTIITYMFAHAGLMHLLFNMLWFHFFGRLVVEYLGNEKLISIYILGGIAGAIAYLFMYNVITFYIEHTNSPGMVGASAAVNAVIVAAATLLPDYTIHLLFFGVVRIKYIALFSVLLSLLGITGGNAGGNIAHLGGSVIGYLFIRSLQSGTDIGRWIITLIHFFRSFFVSAPAMKVNYSRSKKKKATSSKPPEKNDKTKQQQIDIILDKISQSGYESLSKEEKQRLFDASKK